MPLTVATARLGSYRHPDGFDVTRQFGGAAADPFAPSWPLLRETKDRQRGIASEHARETTEALRAGSPRLVSHARTMRDLALEDLWAWYAPRYLAEMRQSYRDHRPAWDALLARPRAVLLCVCPDPARCHRRLLAGILVKLGARDEGEVGPPAPPAQGKLQLG